MLLKSIKAASLRRLGMSGRRGGPRVHQLAGTLKSLKGGEDSGIRVCGVDLRGGT